MSEQNLNLIYQSMQEIQNLKKPDLSKVDGLLRELIRATGGTVQERDILDFLDIEDSLLYATYSWSSRGCVQSETHTLPISILEAKDPLLEAKAWGRQNQLNNLLEKKAELERELQAVYIKIQALD